MNLFEKMGLTTSPEVSKLELNPEEKATRIAEIKAKLVELRTASQGAHGTARQYHQAGGIGSSIYRKVGDISRQIKKLEEELAELTGEPIRPDKGPDETA